MSIGQDRALCMGILPRVSRTFALSIEALPEEMREAVRVSYLLCRVVDTLEDEPGVHRHRRRAWFDTFDALLRDGALDPGALAALTGPLGQSEGDRDLLASSAAVFRVFRSLPGPVRELVVPRVHDMSLGMRMYACRADAEGAFVIRDLEDLERYCYYVAGTVGELLTDLFTHHVPGLSRRAQDALRARATAFGLGLQLVNVVKDVAEDHARGFLFLPRDRLAREGADPTRLLDEEQRVRGLRVVREVCARARRHLDQAREYTLLWPLPSGAPVRLFCAVPLLLALGTLAAVEGGQDTLVAGRSPKVSREQVHRVMRDAFVLHGDDEGLRGVLMGAGP